MFCKFVYNKCITLKIISVLKNNATEKNNDVVIEMIDQTTFASNDTKVDLTTVCYFSFLKLF